MQVVLNFKGHNLRPTCNLPPESKSSFPDLFINIQERKREAIDNDEYDKCLPAWQLPDDP